MARVAAVLALLMSLPALSTAQSSSPREHPQATGHRPPASESAVPPALVGLWRARPDRVPLSVPNGWGTEGTAVTQTEVRLSTDGTGVITVQRRVVNKAGATLPGSRVVDSATFTLEGEQTPLGLRPYYSTAITKASRRLFDPLPTQSTLEGLTLRIYAPSDSPNAIEVSYEPFDGEGSFSGTLERQRTGG